MRSMLLTQQLVSISTMWKSTLEKHENAACPAPGCGLLPRMRRPRLAVSLPAPNTQS